MSRFFRNTQHLTALGARATVAVALLISSAAFRTVAAQGAGRTGPANASSNGSDWIALTPDDPRDGITRANVAPEGTNVPASEMHFHSRKDSVAWASAVRQARRARGLRIEVSLHDRMLWVINGRDTLRTAPIAVGMGEELEYAGRRWFFATPRGKRTVLRKEADPVWIPPEWAYAEVAREYGLKLAHMTGKPIKLSDGRILTVRDSLAGVLEPAEDGSKKLEFAELPTDEHIVFGNTLYVPPPWTKNRRIEGELGKYRLDLGDGYLLHGTPHQDSIGRAATHGCVRLLDEDIEWLYDNIPVGTAVYIY